MNRPQDDALVFDVLALELRRQVGRPVKSEIVRALVHLAACPGPVADRLGDVLDRRTAT
ncbi:hypothetical protein [Streptomyces sp. NPDC058291]|uniref:hypothetical protein n=1 Tax=Streptomyces sp. NPDC058291 TaxID=3346427 RepID=UPI0036EF15A2